MRRGSTPATHILFDYIERLVSNHCDTTLFRHSGVRDFPQLNAVEESFRGINTAKPRLYGVYMQKVLYEKRSLKISLMLLFTGRHILPVSDATPFHKFLLSWLFHHRKPAIFHYEVS